MSKFLSIMLTKAERNEAWHWLLVARENVTECLRGDSNDASSSYKKSARLLDSILKKFSEAKEQEESKVKLTAELIQQLVDGGQFGGQG